MKVGIVNLPRESWSKRNVSRGQQKVWEMARREHTPVQVINKPREAEVAIAEGTQSPRLPPG